MAARPRRRRSLGGLLALLLGLLVLVSVLVPGGRAQEAVAVEDAAAEAAVAAVAAAADQDAGREEGAATEAAAPSRPKRSLQEVLAIAGRQALGGGLPGALAGALQVLALMPLRTLTNCQYRYGGSFVETAVILLKQGGIPRFYQGLSFALVQGPLARFGATAANAGVRALFENMALTQDLPLVVATALAAVAAGCWRLLLMPIDTAKTVSQVQGAEGFRALMRRVALQGDIAPLYQGAVATAISASLGHFPWFLTHDVLSARLPRPRGLFLSIARNGFIGFLAAAVADVFTNSIRVIKTTKQSAAAMSSLSYLETIQVVLAADGYRGLFGRGLGTRILTNGVQSILFTILWEALQDGMVEPPPVTPPYLEEQAGGHSQPEPKGEQQPGPDGLMAADGGAQHIRGAPQPVVAPGVPGA